MPVTVRGGDILFNDGTTQSSAGGAVNTTTVLNATAGASIGAVGSYAFAYAGNNTVAPGNTISGASLRYVTIYRNIDNQYNLNGSTGTLPGTWRLMGGPQATSGSESYLNVTLWLRIS